MQVLHPHPTSSLLGRGGTAASGAAAPALQQRPPPHHLQPAPAPAPAQSSSSSSSSSLSFSSRGTRRGRRARCGVHAPQRPPPPPLRSSELVDASDMEDYEHPIDAEEFRSIGYQVVDWVADYYKSLETRRPAVKDPKLKPGFLNGKLADSAPEAPEPWAAAMKDYEEKLMPGVVHWQSPSFFAYFSANSSFPAMLGDMLASATNMIGFSWAGGPASTELEMQMMDWLAKLCGLPEKFLWASEGNGGGVIQGTSSEAVIVALLAARARTLRGRPPADALKLVTYASDQTHSCYQKACMIAGIPHVRVLPTRAEDDYALQPSVLQAAIEEDRRAGLLPCFVCVSIGTTSSCAIDPVGDLARVAHEASGSTGPPVWCHADAAYAGSAAVCPKQRAAYFTGMEELDSYSFNPHKWLLTNFDCCAFWAADSTSVKEALSLTPVFLQATGNDHDLKDWQLPLGRRFRALKLYFVLRCYGGERLRAFIRHHCALAAWFGQQVASDARFELAAPVRFGLVCFRLKGLGNEVNKALLDALNARGDIFLIHTSLDGQLTLRLAVGSTGTQKRHVEHALAAVQEEADRLLARLN